MTTIQLDAIDRSAAPSLVRCLRCRQLTGTLWGLIVMHLNRRATTCLGSGQPPVIGR